jgi:hypothetical protein
LRRARKSHAIVLAQLILAGIILPALATPSHAARDTQSGFSLVVSEVRSLSIDSGSSYLSPGAAEILAGWTQEHSTDITISSNTEWVLSIRGASPTWDGPWAKPVGDVYWSCNGSDYMPLSTDPAQVCLGGPSDHRPYPINFKVHLDPLKDIPGDYRYTSIVLELTAP